MRNAYFVASVQHDTEDQQTADSYAYGNEYKHLVESVNDLIKTKKNGEVLFAAYVDSREKEHDITEKVRTECKNKKEEDACNPQTPQSKRVQSVS